MESVSIKYGNCRKPTDSVECSLIEVLQIRVLGSNASSFYIFEVLVWGFFLWVARSLNTESREGIHALVIYEEWHGHCGEELFLLNISFVSYIPVPLKQRDVWNFLLRIKFARWNVTKNAPPEQWQKQQSQLVIKKPNSLANAPIAWQFNICRGKEWKCST